MPISSYLKSVRNKVGNDLLMMTAASVSIFDTGGKLLLGRDAETNFWSFPGGAVDPHEQPADAAVRECFEETGLLVQLDALMAVFGGPEFLIRYPNGDVTL
jgi:8-oxo-dGTP pyrophosphatase MutT (NUDIX family)